MNNAMDWTSPTHTPQCATIPHDDGALVLHIVQPLLCEHRGDILVCRSCVMSKRHRCNSSYGHGHYASFAFLDYVFVIIRTPRTKSTSAFVLGKRNGRVSLRRRHVTEKRLVAKKTIHFLFFSEKKRKMPHPWARRLTSLQARRSIFQLQTLDKRHPKQSPNRQYLPIPA